MRVKPISEFFSVVVAGSMNPAIHHPSWYHAAEIFSEDTADAALKAPVIVTPPMAQFQTSRFTVRCLQDRWEINTDKAECADEIRDVAAQVFQALMHTPVTAFGMNRHLVFETQKGDAVLADLLSRTGVPFGDTHGFDGLFTYRFQESTSVVSVTVQKGTTGNRHLLVQLNRHFPIQKQAGFFALEKDLIAADEQYRERNDEIVFNLAQALA